MKLPGNWQALEQANGRAARFGNDVDEFDADILTTNMGMSNPTQSDGDLNGDGYVYLDDLDLMFAQYGLELELVS